MNPIVHIVTEDVNVNCSYITVCYKSLFLLIDLFTLLLRQCHNFYAVF